MPPAMQGPFHLRLVDGGELTIESSACGGSVGEVIARHAERRVAWLEAELARPDTDACPYLGGSLERERGALERAFMDLAELAVAG